MNSFSKLTLIIFLFFHSFAISQTITSKNISNHLSYNNTVRHIEVFPASQKMFTCDNLGNGKLWDLKSETIISEFSSSGPFAINVSPDFEFFYSVTTNGVLQKINTKSKKIIATKDLKASEVLNLSFSKNGKWLFVIAQNKICKVTTKDLSFTSEDNLGKPDVLGQKQLTFCPVNEIYATPDKYGKKFTHVYKAMTQNEIAVLPFTGKDVVGLTFDPNGKFLAKQPFAGFLEIYDAKTGDFLYRMDCEKDFVNKKSPYRSITYTDQFGKFRLGTCMPPSDVLYGENGKFIFEVIGPVGLVFKWDLEKGTLVNAYKNKSGQIMTNTPKPKDIYFKSVDARKNIIYGNDRNGRLYKYNLKTEKVSEIGQPILKVQNATYDKTKESIKVYTKDNNGNILKINTKTKSLKQQEHYFPNSDYLAFDLSDDDRYAIEDYSKRMLFDSKTGEAYKLPYSSHISGGGFEGKTTFSKDENYFVAQTHQGIYYGKLVDHLKPELHEELKLTHWKFADDKESIIYLTNATNQSTLKKLNLLTKTIEVLWNQQDQSLEALYFSYSPDKKKISINLRKKRNSKHNEIIILDQSLKKELYRWKEGGIYYADWLDNSTLVSYSAKDFAVLDLKTKSTIKLQGKGKHYCTYTKKKQATFNLQGDTFAGISLKKGNPLFIFDNNKKEFWQLDSPCFQNVNTIEMNEDGEELLIVFQDSIIARLDLKNRKVIAQYRFAELNNKIILVEN